MLSLLLKLVLGGTLALALLVPLGVILAVIGVPVLLLLVLLAVPVSLVLAVVGLPVFLTILFAGVLFAVVVGLLGAIVGLTVAAVKVALFVVLPIAVVVWLLRRIRGERAQSTYGWA